MTYEGRSPKLSAIPDPGDHGYFDRTVVRRLFNEHIRGQEDHQRLLFPILNFDLWYRTFFSQASDRT